MKLRAFAGLICCAALLGLPGVAQAKAPIPTTGTVDDGGPLGTDFVFFGHLTSTNSNCLADRTLKLIFIYADGPKLVDTATSSTNGYWGIAGDATDATGVRLRATKKTFGPKGHRRTCAATSIEVVA